MPRTIPTVLLPLALLPVTLQGCGDPPQTTPAASLGPLEHDFGTLRHGDRATHVFTVPTPDDGNLWIPVGYQRNCTCASHQFQIRAADGAVRYPTGQPFGQFAVQDGERLELHLYVDTSTKEPASAKPVSIPGQLVLQASGVMPVQRVFVPTSFRFGIEARIEVQPAATIDFGRMPHDQPFARTYSLRAVEGQATYGAVRCLERDPRNPNLERDAADIQAQIVMAGDEAELRVEFRPSIERPAGPCAMRIEVETDLPGGYRLVLPFSAFVVDAIEVAPSRMLFGQIDFEQPFTKHIRLTDHNRNRGPEFYVRRIVDEHGIDMSAHFAARLDRVEDSPRSRLLMLDYKGTLPADVRHFRGQIHLAKEPSGDTVRSLEFSGFRRRR